LAETPRKTGRKELGRGVEGRRAWDTFLQSCLLQLVMSPWVRHLLSLGFSLLMYKMKVLGCGSPLGCFAPTPEHLAVSGDILDCHKEKVESVIPTG
jgi:hypothetical protein